MSGPPQIFDSGLLRTRRNRVAADAALHDFLLHRVAEDFAERLSVVRRNFSSALNLGAHHGVLSRRLRALPNVSQMIDLDSAERLLSQADGPRVLANEDTLPCAPQSLDLVVSGLALHLVNDLPGTLAQVQRALKPDGLFLAALLGGETLKELREAWLVAEDEVCGGASPRVAPFADVRDLGALLQRAGFALPVADSDVVRVTYATPLALMREIKATGASNMLVSRRRVPVTKTLLARACEVYAERFGLPDGRVTATFEIITLTAWSPHDSQQKPLQPGSAKRRLADALGVTETSAGEAAPATPTNPATKE
jgi:NADH dehydrogenase [ubiquinone] 1 alpha subcomplex assembly factor 5